MQKTINRWLESQIRWRLVSLGVLLCLVIGLVDYVVKIDLSISTLYLLPMAIAAWYVSKNAGILLAVLCSLAWILAEAAARNYDNLFLPTWNFGIRLSLFVLVSYLISLQKQAYQRETQFARTDELTGLYNRRFFTEILRLEMERSRRYYTKFTLAYLDVDNFKAVNDQLGHGEDDHLLEAMAQQLRSVLRGTDTVGRLGGDEFAILLPHIDSERAYRTLDRIHAQLKLCISDTWPVGFSIGAVTFLKSPDSVAQAIAQADQVMYDIKKSGKNRLELRVVHSDGGKFP